MYDVDAVCNGCGTKMIVLVPDMFSSMKEQNEWFKENVDKAKCWDCKKKEKTK